MTRKTSGRIVSLGGFLATFAVFFLPLIAVWPAVVVTVIAVMMGVAGGVLARAIAQSGWPRMPQALRDLDAPAEDYGLDVLRPAPSPYPAVTERRTYRRDVDETVVTSVAEVFADRPSDLTTLLPLKSIPGYRGAHGKAGAR